MKERTKLKQLLHKHCISFTEAANYMGYSLMHFSRVVNAHSPLTKQFRYMLESYTKKEGKEFQDQLMDAFNELIELTRS